MRFSLTRRGGFAGLHLPPLVLDTAALPPAIASELERLARELKSVDADLAQRTAAPAQPDRFSYTLTVTTPDGTGQTFTFDETSATPALEGIVNTLQNAARK